MGAAPVLKILKNGEEVKSLPITGESMLGRSEGCVIRLDDRAISRQHAVLRPLGPAQGDGVQIEKRSEFAPLSVNGAECTSAILRDGDVVEIGPYLMKLSMKSAQPAPAQPQAPAQPPAPARSQVRAAGPRDASIASIPDIESPGEGQAPSEAPPADALAEQEFGGVPGLQGGEQLQVEGSGQFQPDAALSLESPGVFSGDLGAAEEALSLDDGGATSVIAAADIACRLLVPPGAANVEEFEFKKDEVVIGRKSACDIVLGDKKASGRNTVVRRDGVRYFVKDLDSSNGTYLNGSRISEERELSGDDWIRIGQTEIQFKADSRSYAARAKDLPAVIDATGAGLGGDPLGLGAAAQGPPAADAFAGMAPAAPGPSGGAMTGAIAGIGPSASSDGSLLGKFRAMPKRRRIVLVVVVAAFLYLVMDEDEPEKAPQKVAQGQKKDKGPITFAQLTAEQKKFVEAEHAMAFDYYKARDYDKCLFELNKIFALVQDYKDSREIERYAKEGKRKLEAIEEEKRRKEDEARTKAKIETLVNETRSHMDHKEYDKARDMFPQILTIDPDNKDVENWRKELQSLEEAKRVDEQRKQVMAEVNRRGWEVYREGVALAKKGQCREAIARFKEIGGMAVSSEKLIDAADDQVASCELSIAKRRDPLLDQAKDAEAAGDFKKAYYFFKQAVQVDPQHPAGYAGIDRVKGVLHDRAKAIYTEAVLAESFSDFFTAKKRFQECLDTAPDDDVYHERAQRRLARYFKYEGAKDGEVPAQ